VVGAVSTVVGTVVVAAVLLVVGAGVAMGTVRDLGTGEDPPEQLVATMDNAMPIIKKLRLCRMTPIRWSTNAQGRRSRAFVRLCSGRTVEPAPTG
jgi:hypothetical protein